MLAACAQAEQEQIRFSGNMGVRIRGTLGDFDPLNEVPESQK